MPALPHPDYLSLPEFSGQLGRIDDDARVEALQMFMKPFHAKFRERLVMPRPDYGLRIGHGDQMLAELQRDGVAFGRVEPELKRRLTALAWPFAEAVEHCVDERASMSLKACQMVLEGGPAAEAGALLEQIFAQTGVYAAANAYAGRPLRLYRIGVQVNTAYSTRQRYGEVDAAGVPEHATSYFHIDSGGWPGIKVLIYLTEVELDQGPFRYVVGSHRWAGDFELSVRKATRKLAMPRRLFMALPDEFRMDADFGDHLDPDAEDAAAALAGERAVCDGASDIILFDYSGVHRGGFVREGKRYMLQCSLTAAEEAPPLA